MYLSGTFENTKLFLQRMFVLYYFKYRDV